MKKYYFLLIGIALLLVSIKINTIEYPKFEPFQTEAPLTVSMVIDHNVGTHLQLDLASDIAGFVLIIFSAILFLRDSQDIDTSDTKLRRRTERSQFFFKKLYIWSGIGIAFYLINRLMPFYLNGNLRFRAEYAIYFLYLLANILVILYAFLGVTALFDSLSNHSYNNVTILIGLASIICLLVARVVYFFDITIGYFVYYTFSVVAMACAIYRINTNLHED